MYINNVNWYDYGNTCTICTAVFLLRFNICEENYYWRDPYLSPPPLKWQPVVALYSIVLTDRLRVLGTSRCLTGEDIGIQPVSNEIPATHRTELRSGLYMGHQEGQSKTKETRVNKTSREAGSAFICLGRWSKHRERAGSERRAHIPRFWGNESGILKENERGTYRELIWGFPIGCWTHAGHKRWRTKQTRGIVNSG